MSKVLELTYQQVANSKVYVSQNGMMKFNHPLDYMEPFMETLNEIGVQWTFQAEKGSENKNDKDSDETNIAYSRLIAKAKLPAEYDIHANDPMFKHLTGEIGFVYALDTAKPEMKVYKGDRVTVCTNQCIWGTDSILQLVMNNNSSVNDIYDKTKKFVDNAHKDMEVAKRFIEKYTNEIYRDQMIEQKFGQLVKFGIENPKFGITFATGAIQEILNPKSKYSLEQDKSITAWKFYNSITEAIKQKSSILDEASRTSLLTKLFPLSVN